jgi:hypothetical protein
MSGDKMLRCRDKPLVNLRDKTSYGGVNMVVCDYLTKLSL